MLIAMSAVLHHFESVGVIFLVLFRNIVSVLAFCASKCDFHAHCRHLLYEIFRIPHYLGAECERKLASLFFLQRAICGDAEAHGKRQIASTTKAPLQRGKIIIPQFAAFVKHFPRCKADF